MLRSILASLALAGGLTTAATADDRFAADFSVGTTGISVEGKFALSDQFVLRGGYNYLAWELDGEEYDGVIYDTELDFSTIGAFVDFHPFSNGFLVSGGVYQGPKEINATAVPTTSVNVGGVNFTPEEIGQLDLAADLEDTAPFIGLGWDSTFSGNGPIAIKFIAGAMFSGSPGVDLTSTGGTRSNDPIVQDAIAQEINAVESELEDFEFYPVLSLGLSYRF